MQEKALELVTSLDRKELKGEGGKTRLLSELYNYYKKERRMHKMRKVEEYYKIEKKHRDNMGLCKVV